MEGWGGREGETGLAAEEQLEGEDGGEDVGKKRHGEWGSLGVLGERVKG